MNGTHEDPRIVALREAIAARREEDTTDTVVERALKFYKFLMQSDNADA